MPLTILFLYAIILALPQKPKIEGSQDRLSEIKCLDSKNDLRSNCRKCELVRAEMKYLDFEIKSSKSFSIVKYLNKNIFMQKLIDNQSAADREIDRILKS